MDTKTPLTDALISSHSDEHVSMYAAGNWRNEDAVRQVKELIRHARRMERDRAELLAALVEIANDPQAETLALSRSTGGYEAYTLAGIARAAIAKAKG